MGAPASFVLSSPNFPPGEVYNIGGEQEQTNLEVTKMVVEMFGKGEIKHVEDRPAHDRRYSLNSAKFEAQFGKIASRDFVLGLQQTIDWYRSHPEIFERIECDDPRRFRAQHYQKQE